MAFNLLNFEPPMSKAELYNFFAALKREKYGPDWQKKEIYHFCPKNNCNRLKRQVKGNWYCPIHDKEALRIAEYKNGGLRTIRPGHIKYCRHQGIIEVNL